MTECGSTYYGAQCGLPADHISAHTSRHSSGHITVWTDQAADNQEEATDG